MAEVKVTKDNFEEVVLKSDIPVLVDFWASWCGPCRMIAPILSEIAEENEGKVLIAKVNVDEEEELAVKFRVMSIPMILAFKNGQVVNQMIGYRPKADVLAMIQ